MPYELIATLMFSTMRLFINGNSFAKAVQTRGSAPETSKATYAKMDARVDT